ncbi:MAG: response regulator [Deltaproteobacteria bacterium]|nr:response regulator [Deltaproteobacteria bacterium]
MSMNKAGKILLVDDEEALRLLYFEALALKGYHVECAASGEQALEMLRRSRWSLVISDVCMPGMGGIALYDAVREEYPYLNDRFLFITGKFMERAELSRLKVKCLAKPFRLAELMAAADKLMKRALAKTVHEDAERRKAQRQRRKVKCVLHDCMDAGGQRREASTLLAKTRDFSNDGVGIEYDEESPLEPHSSVNVAVSASGLSFNARANVMWSIPLKEGGWMTGLQWAEPRAEMAFMHGRAVPGKRTV